MTKPWNDYKEEIVRLYIQEGRTLQDVMAIMSEQHGFQASVRSYRQHFDTWGVAKYNCKRRQDKNSAPANLPSPPTTPSLTPRMEENVPSRSSSGTYGGEGPQPDLSYPYRSIKEEAYDVHNNVSMSFQSLPTAPTSQPRHFKEGASLGLNGWSPAGRAAAPDWPHRATYDQKEDLSRYSPEEPAFLSTGQISPTCLDHQKNPLFDAMDWSMSKSRPTSHYAAMPPAIRQHHEPDHKPLHGAVFSPRAPMINGLMNPVMRPQASAPDSGSAVLELRNKQPCVDRSPARRPTNMQVEFA